jgi:hypothetical protein
VTDTGSKPPLDFPELESGGGVASADEFANIPSSRRRHPAIALGAAALAAFLLYQIHDDVFFAISHSEARDLGEARALVTAPAGKLPINEYVRVAGTADRESGIIIDTAGSWKFTQFFRVLGTQSRFFVSRVPDPIPVEQAERDVFVGRLIRFADLSFQAAIRKHFSDRVTATHFFASAAMRSGVASSKGGPLALADLMGEQVSLAPNDELAIDVDRPADVEVEMPRSKYPEEGAARAAIEKLGGKILDDPAKPTDRKRIALVVTFPEAVRNQAMNAISELDPKVRFLPVRATFTTRVADLAAGAESLLIKAAGESRELPLAGIKAIRTLASVRIPDDALLLREGERPRDHLKVLIAAAFLLAFALLNLLSLRRRG